MNSTVLPYHSLLIHVTVGNIMVRVVDGDGHVVSTDLCGGGAGPRGGGGDLDSPGGRGPLRTQLVLLDFGLAEELSSDVRHHFISFLNSICSGKFCYIFDPPLHASIILLSSGSRVRRQSVHVSTGVHLF